MAARSGSSSFLGVDVCLDEEVLANSPHCPHGPTLLFERFVGNEAHTRRKQQYYSCSACRDRKDCDFFQLVELQVSEAGKLAREEDNRSKQPWKSHSKFYQRYTKTLNLKEDERRFCHKCNQLVLPSEIDTHKGHNIKQGLSVPQLNKPSQLLRPIGNRKTNAQYLFSDTAVDFLLTTIEQLGFDRILCVGAPRIHEAIQVDSSRGLKSLLLDIDHRYGQFYPPESFCRYNMFNHYFLDGDNSQAEFNNFLRLNHGDGIVMVTDPPFGGLVDVLTYGMKWIMRRWKEANKKDNDTMDLSTMWIFPYFMETRIQESLPSFHMLDYKVAYDNHPLFQSKGKSSKKGSPVRIFTNVEASKFVLPKEQGYRLCATCNRYVSSENRHCAQCKSCTSKDGTTYRHCKLCQRCVKPSYVHCKTCRKCGLATHRCNVNMQHAGCHICGAMDHKRRDCPQRGGQQQRSTNHSKRKKKRTNDIDTNNLTPSKLRKLSSESNTETVGVDEDQTKGDSEDSGPSESVAMTPPSKVDEKDQQMRSKVELEKTVKKHDKMKQKRRNKKMRMKKRKPVISL